MSFKPNSAPLPSLLKEKNVTIPYIALIVRNLPRGTPNDAFEAATNVIQKVRQQHSALASVRIVKPQSVDGDQNLDYLFIELVAKITDSTVDTSITSLSMWQEKLTLESIHTEWASMPKRDDVRLIQFDVKMLVTEALVSRFRVAAAEQNILTQNIHATGPRSKRIHVTTLSFPDLDLPISIDVAKQATADDLSVTKVPSATPRQIRSNHPFEIVINTGRAAVPPQGIFETLLPILAHRYQLPGKTLDLVQKPISFANTHIHSFRHVDTSQCAVLCMKTWDATKGVLMDLYSEQPSGFPAYLAASKISDLKGFEVQARPIDLFNSNPWWASSATAANDSAKSVVQEAGSQIAAANTATNAGLALMAAQLKSIQQTQDLFMTQAGNMQKQLESGFERQSHFNFAICQSMVAQSEAGEAVKHIRHLEKTISTVRMRMIEATTKPRKAEYGLEIARLEKDLLKAEEVESSFRSQATKAIQGFALPALPAPSPQNPRKRPRTSKNGPDADEDDDMVRLYRSSMTPRRHANGLRARKETFLTKALPLQASSAQPPKSLSPLSLIYPLRLSFKQLSLENQHVSHCQTVSNCMLHPHNPVMGVFLSVCGLVLNIFNLLSTFKSSGTFLLILLFILPSLCTTVSAAALPLSGLQPLSIYSLNATGLGTPLKVANINSTINSIKPSAYIITETQSQGSVKSKFESREYERFENPSVPKDGAPSYKWGILVGIHRDIQVKQQVTLDVSLKGRVIALDLVLNSGSRYGTEHRMICVYAPWDPGARSSDGQFWEHISSLCSQAPNGWSVNGDFNATLAIHEKSSRSPKISAARRQTEAFLMRTGGIDLWSRYEDRDALVDWTWRRNSASSIIDRTVISPQGVQGGNIHTVTAREHCICHTDHRAILATFFPCPSHELDDQFLGSTSRTREFARPRLRYPKKGENHQFVLFSSTIGLLSKEKGLTRTEIDSEAKWIAQYEVLTEVMTQAAETAFERPVSGNRTTRQMSSSLEVQAILGERHNINSILYSYRVSWATGMRPSAANYLRRLVQDLVRTNGNDIDLWPQILTKLRVTRNKLNKELFAQRKKEAAENDRKSDTRRMMAALRGGSVKRNLLSGGNSVLTPLAVESQDGRLCTDPDDVNRETCQYFTKLYAKPTVPVCEKPWMETESVKTIRAKVERNPFEWPQLLELTTFQSMLRKGNARPSPGPDGWEKWIVKRLPEDALLIVMDLINYMITNSLSPPRIKSMLLNIIYKKGARTSLSNWRAVTFSNFLFNAPATWLNTCLLPYCADIGIIPDTQVATQIGVQTRDLTSFLAQLECWSARHSQPLYILKRDQMKGFDYLSPQGFYDALTAYGLPDSIAALDQSLQDSVTCHIRTAFGLAGPITLDGVTKQGGPLSPLKSTLTTSMGHRYLQDLAAASSNLLTITTANANCPHTLADAINLPITVVEATDDSFLIATTLPALHELTITAERFQFCYNWLTSWPKSLVMILNADGLSHERTLEMPSISLDDPFNRAVTIWHNVEATYDHCVFLGAKINDGKDRFDELREFIVEYPFPRLSIRLPHNIVRRIVLGAIMPRIRALLTIQPVTHRQAEELDVALAQRVHQLLGFRFPPNISILSLPVEMNGLGFPSIARMNRALCMEGLMRDLNHHIPAYRAMAEMTMADWTCELNRCCNPVSTFGRQLKDFSKHPTYASKIPIAWIVAQSAMRDLPEDIQIFDSDQSSVMRGDISIRHASTRIASLSTLATPTQKPNPSLPDWRIVPLPSHTIRALTKHGITMLSQMGSWTSALTFTVDFPPIGNLSNVARTAMEAQAANTIAFLDGIRMAWLIDGPVDLGKPKELRESDAINFIRAVARPSAPDIQAVGIHTWATDGSMRPNPRRMHESRIVTAAVTGPSTAALQIPGRTASILHGEVLALVMAQTLANSAPETRIISDHMNSVKLLSHPAGIHNDKWIRKANGRSLYRWYAKLNEDRNIPLIHVKAHTGGDDSDSRLNGEADRVATAASAQPSSIPAAPEPTFTMDRQVLHSPADGYIEASIYRYVEHHLSLHTAQIVYSQPSMRMAQSLYNPTPPPQYPYTKSLSSYSATVQLYARSGQLDVMSTRFARHLQDTPYCDFGCREAQTMHHIFIECTKFASLREEATKQAVTSVKRALESFKIDSNGHPLIEIAESLFCDSAQWPASHSVYYLGWLPKLEEHVPQDIISPSETAKLNRAVTADLHVIAIRLAGRIWGQIARWRTARWRDNNQV